MNGKKILKLKKIDQSLNSNEKTLLSNFIGNSSPNIIIELGVYKGSTTKFINEFLDENGINAKIIGFDLEEVIFGLKQNDKKIKKMLKQNKLELIGGLLPFTLEKFLKKNSPIIDFVLIDAKHDYQSVFGELTLIWPYLSNSGYIICHDYHKVRLQYAIQNFSKKNNARFIPILNTDVQSNFQSSFAVITKSKLDFKFLTWLRLHFKINEIRGYYLLKRILKFLKFF